MEIKTSSGRNRRSANKHLIENAHADRIESKLE